MRCEKNERLRPGRRVDVCGRLEIGNHDGAQIRISFIRGTFHCSLYAVCSHRTRVLALHIFWTYYQCTCETLAMFPKSRIRMCETRRVLKARERDHLYSTC